VSNYDEGVFVVLALAHAQELNILDEIDRNLQPLTARAALREQEGLLRFRLHHAHSDDRLN
jgi:hypothetical protein